MAANSFRLRTFGGLHLERREVSSRGVKLTRFDSLASGEGLDWDGYAIRGLGRYRAAGAWEQAGDSAKAAAAYRAFLEAWRQGDPDLRSVRHARRQLGRSSRAQ